MHNHKSLLILTLLTTGIGYIIFHLNQFTVPIISERQHAAEQAVIQKLLPDLQPITTIQLATPKTHQHQHQHQRTWCVYHHQALLYSIHIFRVKRGYAGPIQLITRIDSDQVIDAIEVLHHQETPGIGDKVESSNSQFLQQFIHHNLILDNNPEYVPLSGATITSVAIIRSILSLKIQPACPKQQTSPPTNFSFD